jgi:hypothetical protein
MNSALAALPPLAKVALVLRKTTEVLAHELAVPTNKPPVWTEFEWRMGRAVAAMHGISSILHSRLRWDGPASWRQFLQEQRNQSVGRQLQIARLLDAIDSQARCQGIPVIALKGAALHSKGFYAPGERPMGDIDLLIRKDDAHATARFLQSCDYEAAFTSHRHEVFRPRVRKAPAVCILGEHVDNPIKIEVHTRISESLPVVPVDITQYLFPQVARAGLNEYPSAVALMMHLLMHAAGNIRARALRLIQLHDIALLAARFGSSEWDELLATYPDSRGLWWALAPLMLAARYYPATIPPDILARASIGCPWLLGRLARHHQLTDVSWSNIRIEAFPGVEWSRTPREALDFIISRTWPSRKARMELKIGTAEIPGVSTVPWYRISHGARIVRWIFSRPPRVQTLLSVRAALAQDS